MKLLSNLKNIIPLTGCTISDLGIALKKEDYFTPTLRSLMTAILSNTIEEKQNAISILSASLFLMNTHSLFVDFSKDMVLVETEDSKEFYVCYCNNSDLKTNLHQILDNLSIDRDRFVTRIKDTLNFSHTEKDPKKLWNILVDMSVKYLDTK